MKIALLGYGKMGKLIEEIARDKHSSENFEIVAKIDPKLTTSSITKENLNMADVCIDFTNSAAFLENIESLGNLGQTVVAGTTGWYDQMDKVKEIVKSKNMGFLYAANFSIGVNIFLEIIKKAASLIEPFEEYDLSGFEIHHKEKEDSPSGTALLMSSIIMKQLKRKNSLLTQANGKIKDNEFHLASLRSGTNPGFHTLVLDSHEDTITLSHQAKNRNGFAKGALLAAKWLKGKKGFYTINDFLGDFDE